MAQSSDNIKVRFGPGPEKYFIDLYNRQSGPLFWFANVLLKSEEDAHDVVADVFQKVWANFDKLKDIENVEAYLRQMTRNACFDIMRRSKLKARVEQELLGRQDEHIEEIEEQAQIRSNMYEHMHAQVQKLNPKYRTVFKLAFVEGKRNDEVAEELNMSNRQVSDIKVLIKKALKVNSLSPTMVFFVLTFLLRK